MNKQEILNSLVNQLDAVIMSNKQYEEWSKKNPIMKDEKKKIEVFIKKYRKSKKH